MIGWGVPTPYPDELAYSVLARFTHQWHRVDESGLLTCALGGEFRHAHWASVPGISTLASKAYPHSERQLLTFAHRNTLLNYVMAFIPQDTRNTVVAALNSDPRASSSVLLQLAASRHSWPRTMRLCNECLESDIRCGRTPYWRRAHHLPGLSRCTDHGILLHETSEGFTNVEGFSPLTPLNVECHFDKRSEVKPMFSRTLERALTGPSLQAMKTTFAALPKRPTVERYRRSLLKIYPSEKGRYLATTGLVAHLHHWLRRHRCDDAALGPASWVKVLVTNLPGTPSTLQHLVLRAFLKECFSDRLARNLID